jgi:N-acetylglucosaminyl-diphospho-decaprenol L-rhamnosyltransferase
MRLSVVIVTYNSAHCIGECVRALTRVLPNCEVIVVDNMSADATVSTTTATDARVRVVQMGGNAGFGRACNAGVRCASHDHVLLMNPDVVLLHAERDELELAFAQENLGLMAGELIGPHARAPAQARLFRYRSWISELLYTALGPFEPRELSQHHRFPRVHAPAWACAAVLLIRRSEFLALGGFDERFFLYYEDQELGERYREANLPIRGTAAIRAVHRTGTSSPLATEELIYRMAWCLLGWLELVAMHHGPQRARLSWAIVGRTHHAGRVLATLLARSSQTGRMRSKAEQMASLEDAIGEIARTAQHSTHGFCPIACRVVAGGA